MAIKINKSLLTGIIIEEGSNSKGSYIKFSNGILICRQTITTTNSNTQYHYSSVSWLYPANFSEIPTVIGTANNWNTYASIVKVRPALTYSSVMLHFIASESGYFVDLTGTIDVIAIGRWK